ncbi:MAG: CPBP family intramembrane metalloprotease [Nitrospirae bacterium]|nr:CPBP family intramembrane metalloprotease [Nitrospirota bacterium]
MPVSRFSSFLTGLSVLILLGGLVLFGWLQFTVPRLDRVASPERALALMVGREMEMEEALIRAPLWERWLYELTISESANEKALAIDWYEELAGHSGDARDVLSLVILEAEDGRLERVRRKVADWQSRPDPFPSFARLLSAGYLDPKPDPANAQTLQAELAELLPGGWFYDRLSFHVAERAGDRAFLAATDQARAGRDEFLLGRARGLVVVQLGSLLLGTFALAVVVRRWRVPDALQVGTAPIPPSWRGKAGVVVLVRGGAVGTLFVLGWLSFGTEDLLLRAISIPMTNLPLLILAQRHLFSRAGRGFTQGLGLCPGPSGWERLAVVVPAVLAVGFVGEWGLGRAADSLGLASHWTEWFDGDLVWGGGAVLLVSLLEYVVFAPVFEELVFRGLLFATLRRKFGWGLSATLSAAIFAVAHGYGVLGFVSVLWSGALWAWVYEKTGSLLPGMVAHAVNNLLVCLTVMWLLR